MGRLTKILFICSVISLLSFVIVRSLLGWVPFCWVTLAFFFGLGGAGFWIDRDFFREFLSMKTTKQGLSMGTMILLVITLLAAVNFLGARRFKTWDVSNEKVNSLSDQSIKLVKALKGDLKVIYFYKEGAEGVAENRQRFIDLIRKYQDQSNHVKLEFYEVNENPVLAEKYNIKKGTQSVILDYKGKTNLIEKIDEQELTSALAKVTRDKENVVYLLSGHGELGLEQQPDGASASFLKKVLEGNQYKVSELSFNDKIAIPTDAQAILILGPQNQFQDLEIKALENYLRGGGSIFLAIRPRARHGLDGLLKNLGLKASNSFVVTVMQTPVGRAVDPRRTRAGVFSPTSAITRPFSKSEFVSFQLPEAILHDGSNPPAGITLDDVVKTGEGSVAFESTQFDKEAGQGPFPIAVSAKGKYPGAADGKEFNMLVVGDSNFLSDAGLYNNLNRDLVLNSMAVLVKDENMVTISPKELTRTPFEMPSASFGMFIFFFIIPLPLIMYAASGALFFRRRYL